MRKGVKLILPTHLFIKVACWGYYLSWYSCCCLYEGQQHVCAKLLQFCPTPCDPMDCGPPGSSVHRILQARMLERIAVPYSRGRVTNTRCPKDALQAENCKYSLRCHSLLWRRHGISTWASLESHFLIWSVHKKAWWKIYIPNLSEGLVQTQRLSTLHPGNPVRQTGPPSPGPSFLCAEVSGETWG